MIRSRSRTQPHLQAGSHPTHYTTTLLLLLAEAATPSSNASTNRQCKTLLGCPEVLDFRRPRQLQPSLRNLLLPVWINYWCQCTQSKKDWTGIWILQSAQLNRTIQVNSFWRDELLGKPSELHSAHTQYGNLNNSHNPSLGSSGCQNLHHSQDESQPTLTDPLKTFSTKARGRVVCLFFNLIVVKTL